MELAIVRIFLWCGMWRTGDTCCPPAFQVGSSWGSLKVVLHNHGAHAGRLATSSRADPKSGQGGNPSTGPPAQTWHQFQPLPNPPTSNKSTSPVSTEKDGGLGTEVSGATLWTMANDSHEPSSSSKGLCLLALRTFNGVSRVSTVPMGMRVIT